MPPYFFRVVLNYPRLSNFTLIHPLSLPLSLTTSLPLSVITSPHHLTDSPLPPEFLPPTPKIQSHNLCISVTAVQLPTFPHSSNGSTVSFTFSLLLAFSHLDSLVFCRRHFKVMNFFVSSLLVKQQSTSVLSPLLTNEKGTKKAATSRRRRQAVMKMVAKQGIVVQESNGGGESEKEREERGKRVEVVKM